VISKVKIPLTSLLVLLVVSSIGLATASAEVKGPIWKVRANAKSVAKILGGNETRAVKGQGKGQIDSKLLAEKVAIECESSTAGYIVGGKTQGQIKSTTKLSNCVLTEPKIPACVVGITSSEVKFELAYKWNGEAKQLEEPKQETQDIVGIVLPAKGETLNKAELSKCGVLSGVFEVKGGVIPAFKPGRLFTKSLLSVAEKPNIKMAHHGEKGVKEEAALAGAPAEFNAKETFELTNGGEEEFGAFEE
jgi:hypothetical protein